MPHSPFLQNLLWRYRNALEVAAERILVENTLMGSELEKIIYANPPHPVTDEFHRVSIVHSMHTFLWPENSYTL